jgi:hypothetical protein
VRAAHELVATGGNRGGTKRRAAAVEVFERRAWSSRADWEGHAVFSILHTVYLYKATEGGGERMYIYIYIEREREQERESESESESERERERERRG